MFIVATATFRILYTLIALDHERRKIIHFGVAENPTQVWLSHQMAEAFPCTPAMPDGKRPVEKAYAQTDERPAVMPACLPSLIQCL